MGCHFPLQGIFPTPGMEPTFPAGAGGFLTTEPLGKLHAFYFNHSIYTAISWHWGFRMSDSSFPNLGIPESVDVLFFAR